MEHTRGPVIAKIQNMAEGKANAHLIALIAAAPTMETAIRSMLVNIGLGLKSGNENYFRLAIKAGETAISKAEGRELK